MPIKPRELENLLITKFGFRESKGHSSDHRWLERSIEGIPTIRTMISHSRKEIRQRLESKIARELHVRTDYFRDMVGCTHDAQDYCSQVRRDPYPPWQFDA